MKHQKALIAFFIIVFGFYSFSQDKKIHNPPMQPLITHLDEPKDPPIPPQHPFIPDLTDDQKEQLKKIEQNFLKNILPIENQIGEKEAKLKSLATADKFEMNQLNSTIDEIGILKTKIRKYEMEKIQSIRKLLNDEQRLVFDTHKPPQHLPPLPR